MKKLLTILAILLALSPLSAQAVNVTVPSSPGLGSILYGLASGNYTTLTVGANGDCLKLALGIPSWGSCGSGGGGTDGNWTFFNTSGIRLATTSNQVLIGASSTTTRAALEVIPTTTAAGAIWATGSSTLQFLRYTNATGTAATTTALAITGVTSSLLKTNSTGGVVAAVSGTDYQPAGTYVTAVSIASANGFAGSSSGGATPALTLSTTITGLLKGNGTAISAASAGVDYQAAGNYITALTGDLTASGPGSAAATLATVNSNVGSFTNANITVNGKGLVTAASNGTDLTWSTTSADYYKSQNNFFSTTSADYWDTTKSRWGTTSEQYYQSLFRDWSVVSGTLRPTTTTGIIVAASSTISALTVTNGTTTNATSTNLTVSGTTRFSGLNCSANANGGTLTTDSNGYVSCADDDSSAGGGSYPFQVAGNATSTLTQFNGGLTAYASSTITSLTVTNGTTTNATTTNLAFTGLTSGGLGVNANGQVYKAATTTYSTGLTYTNGAVTVNTSQNIATLSNLTSNGFVKTSGGTGALSVDTNTYLTGNQTITLSGVVQGSGTTGITTSYTGVDPRAWNIVSGALVPTTTIGFITTASSTAQNLQVVNGTTTNATSTNLYVSGTTRVASLNGLIKGTTGVLSAAVNGTDYTLVSAVSCTNKFVRSLTAAGVGTCATVANTDLANSSITINTSGGITGGGSVSLGGTLNLVGYGTTSVNYYNSLFRDWSVVSGTLRPTSTIGVIVSASSTISALTVTNGTTTNATSTNLTVSGTTRFSGLNCSANANGGALTTDANGFVSCSDDDSSAGGGAYPFAVAGNATSTLTQFNGGLTSYASTTIGNGNQNGGLTISGGATTTGNFFVGSGSTVHSIDGSTRRIGVATSSPFTTLSVGGAAYVGGNFTATGTIQFTNISGSTQCLQVDSSGNVTGAGAACGSGSGGSNSKFATSSDSQGIYVNGGTNIRVGIGTTTPHALSTLNIASSSATGLIFSNTNGSTNEKHFGMFWEDRKLYFATTSDSITSTSTAGLTYDPVGEAYFGLGTTSPFYKFSIGTGNGSSTASILVAEHRPATSTSMTIDWKNGNQQNIRIGTAATTVSFSNYTDGSTLKLLVCNPGSGTAGTITWGTEVLWAGGSAPTQTTTANKCDVWSFIGTMGTSTLRVFGSVTNNF